MAVSDIYQQKKDALPSFIEVRRHNAVTGELRVSVDSLGGAIMSVTEGMFVSSLDEQRARFSVSSGSITVMSRELDLEKKFDEGDEFTTKEFAIGKGGRASFDVSGDGSFEIERTGAISIEDNHHIPPILEIR